MDASDNSSGISSGAGMPTEAEAGTNRGQDNVTNDPNASMDLEPGTEIAGTSNHQDPEPTQDPFRPAIERFRETIGQLRQVTDRRDAALQRHTAGQIINRRDLRNLLYEMNEVHDIHRFTQAQHIMEEEVDPDVGHDDSSSMSDDDLVPRQPNQISKPHINECPACTSEVAPHEIVYLNCGHRWCSGCLNNNIRVALSNRSNYPPRCCIFTPSGIDLPSIQSHLEEDVLLRLIDVGEEYATKDPTFCFDPRCSAFISIPKNQEPTQWATCQRCKKITCVSCKGDQNLHPSPDQHPDPMSKEDRELSVKQGWKQCPNSGCRKMIERSEGCDSMKCECGTYFCYRCGRHLDVMSGNIANRANMTNLICNCSGNFL